MFWPYKANKKVSGFWSPRASPQLRALAFLAVPTSYLFIFLLRNDVQLQPKLLDRLEFCRAVKRPFVIGV